MGSINTISRHEKDDQYSGMDPTYIFRLLRQKIPFHDLVKGDKGESKEMDLSHEYCLLCQVAPVCYCFVISHISKEPHKMSSACFTCKQCSVKGHLAKDCPKKQESIVRHRRAGEGVKPQKDGLGKTHYVLVFCHIEMVPFSLSAQLHLTRVTILLVTAATLISKCPSFIAFCFAVGCHILVK